MAGKENLKGEETKPTEPELLLRLRIYYKSSSLSNNEFHLRLRSLSNITLRSSTALPPTIILLCHLVT
ncbi:hypothetical protein L2E82_06030 [Cichorium intybus]|uniref:Uncharacterized protein n=1 Tax=Cichorium intybus TaxID=13427 RepID=A0ACB9H8E2_CICIN|nr:hypothetical protein L2E82_06030 [Cichorium intybus]